jgi:hypothetical protein
MARFPGVSSYFVNMSQGYQGAFDESVAYQPAIPGLFRVFRKSSGTRKPKTLTPPLGLITVAAIVPQSCQFKLVDLNVRQFTEGEWIWADAVMRS